MWVSGFFARLRSRWHGLRHRGHVEDDMKEEFQFHLDLRTDDLVRRGFSPEEARRRAHVEFGHIDSHREDARASRGLAVFDEIRFSALDVKLGLRMLMKYPGLSLVSVIGMAVAIAIGAGGFAALGSMLDTTLPLPRGERIVSIQNSDVSNPGNGYRRSLHDFVAWRDRIESVQDLGAYRTASRNLIIPGGEVTMIRIAEMTASGFRVANTPPVLGRPLLDEDERDEAPRVLVIASEEWQRRFDGDPDVIGREVRIGSEVHTVVGVMPEGFRFPHSHRYWVPLRLNPDDYERGGGPALWLFGRLADGVTRNEAQAEFTTIGLRSAAVYPETHARLRPRVLPYTLPYFDLDSPAIAWMLRAGQLIIGLVLVVVAINVAILVYARTVMRSGELAVRTALGASRRRIAAQLFAEAIVLSGAAAAIGLTIARVALTRVQTLLQGPIGSDGVPFWWRLDLSGGLVGYVFGLAVVAAVIIGVLPALKVTGRQLASGLQRFSTRGYGMHLGKTWTVLIVAQVAIAVAVLPFAGWVAGVSIQRATAAPGYPAEQFLRAWLWMELEQTPRPDEAAEQVERRQTRYWERSREVLRRLETEPAVAGVTFASSVAGEAFGRIRVEADDGEIQRTVINRVDVDFFSVLDVPLLSGRGFVEADRRDDAKGVVVNRVLAEQLFGHDNVVGRRIRHYDRGDGAEGDITRGPWLEIIGVAPDFMMQLDFELPHPRLYEPVMLEDAGSVTGLTVRIVGGSASAFAPRLREIVAEVDPTMMLFELTAAAVAEREAGRVLRLTAFGVAGVVLSVVLLSGAGIYAMMSFTVARRRREIAIRSALGADPRRLLSGLFAHATAQLGAGVLVGLLLAAIVIAPVAGKGLILLPLVAVSMVIVGLLATLGPARRGLAVQPSEALREE